MWELHSFIYIYIYIDDLFLYVRMFSKLFWIHNLGIKFIIHGLILFSFLFFFKLLFSLTHTHINQVGHFEFLQYLQNCHYFHFLWVLCVFTIFTKLPLYSLFMKLKMLKMCFHFLYSNPTFRIQKMKTKYKFLNQKNKFFW